MVYLPIFYHKNQSNLGKYTSPIDPMGMDGTGPRFSGANCETSNHEILAVSDFQRVKPTLARQIFIATVGEVPPNGGDCKGSLPQNPLNSGSGISVSCPGILFHWIEITR